MMLTMMLAAVTHWAVPPMSDEMRLPDRVPCDGEKGGTVRIVVAKDEFEPGSFVVRSDADLGKVKFEIGDLKQVKVKGEGEEVETGVVFPKAGVDLKVVKVWYQNLNSWFSYFGDGGAKLCPELLLNDEDLIRVDTEKAANYARLVAADGKVTEKWLNPKPEMDLRPMTSHIRAFDSFFPMRPDFRDAETLQPVALGKDESKQFWLTVHARPETPAGVYRGEIKGSGIGNQGSGVEFSIPVEIKVMDFALPKPKCHDDPTMDFWVCFYNYLSYEHIRIYNGGDNELAKRQFEAVLRNQVEHNQNMHKPRPGLLGGEAFDEEELKLMIETMRKVGMITRPLVGCGVGTGFKRGESVEETRRKARECRERCDRIFGHHDIYIGYGDEPGVGNLVTRYRQVQDAFQLEGFKFFLAGGGHVFRKNGYLIDWHNTNNPPEADAEPRRWNEIGNGKRIAWYAAQHVGSEDPAFHRRQNGLACWLSGYTALCNYAHHLGSFNDCGGTYKPMVYAYGISTGVIDTLAWEGFREGVDDIRYATLLMSLARTAAASDDVVTRRKGEKALMYLALLERERADLNEARLEMVNHIVRLIGCSDCSIAAGR